ncbi:MAG: Spx/MgsR family RNA polymerase-binding regulatory protein [Mycoplasmataceae bacterium]|jgi:regulatory protein spx|nr:Spx/MgsR family RNA polymerase-binding regulatory protein [Mycoplasmataceae bacterium]
MIKIYTSSGCLGCRQSIKFFKEHNLAYEEKDFTKIPLTRQELKDILSLTEDGFDDILSIRSNEFKKHQSKLDDYMMEDIINLIIQHPQILSRPIIIQYMKNEPYRLLIGYNSNDIEIFLNSDTARMSKKVATCGFEKQCGKECGVEHD